MHIVHVISSLKLGGAENCLLGLVAYLQKNNYQQKVIYFHDGPIKSQIELLGIPTYKISGYIYQYDPIFLMRLYKLIKKLKPDVIHSSLWAANFFGVLIARLLQIPRAAALHTVQEHEGRVRNFLTRFNLPRTNSIIAVGHAVSLSVKKKYDLKNNQVKVIPNGIDYARLATLATENQITRAELGISADAFIIGSVGRFVPVKNYGYLLEICAQLIQASNAQQKAQQKITPEAKTHRAIQVILIGVGPEEENLRMKARELGISDNILFIIGEPAYKYYRLFDCFVQPSLFEGLSIALLEALSLGVPCIVTSKDPMHDVIKDRVNGILCRHENVLEAIKLLYHNPELCEQLGRAGSKTVRESYSLAHMGAQYASVFQELFDGKRSQLLKN